MGNCRRPSHGELAPQRRRLLSALLCAHSLLLGYEARRDSPTLNELAHLVAGVNHWKFGQFDLYRVNPPLVRTVAAIPVVVAGFEMDWSGVDDRPWTRTVFEAGDVFAACNGARTLWLLTLARWACIPFSLLGAWICYAWARDLFGPSAGLVAATLWCFSPTILGHAHLITADAHAAALCAASCYTFWRWLRRPTWGATCLAGVVLGVALLAKLTLIVLPLVWPLLWLAYCFSNRNGTLAREWCRQSGMLCVSLLLALLMLNTGYGFERSFRRLAEFEFVSRTFAGESAQEAKAGLRSSDVQTGNRFANSCLGVLPVPVPTNYVLGMDIQQRDFETNRLPSYLRGEFRERGWWYYYLYAIAVKVPLGTLLLAGLAAIACCTRGGRIGCWCDQLAVLLPALAIFMCVSSQTAFSHHMRFILPCFSLAFVWIAQAGRLAHATNTKLARIACAGIVWMMASSLWIFPHSLSYFNELAGGPNRGHLHLINSNIDWGQDLLHLRSWLLQEDDNRPLHLVYYGRLDPRIAGIDFLVPSNTPDSTTDQLTTDLRPGTYAISVNLLCDYRYPVPNGHGDRCSVPPDLIRSIRKLPIAGKAGYSLWIYRVTFEDAKRIRREMGLPESPPTETRSHRDGRISTARN